VFRRNGENTVSLTPRFSEVIESTQDSRSRFNGFTEETSETVGLETGA
jgi:hypothetical protein